MIYEKRITIPANTPQTAPTLERFRVHPGTLEQVEIEFPTGCAGLVHVQILYQDVQTWPSSLDQDFSGNGSYLVFKETLEVVKAPFEFTIRGWNEDDTYSHTPIIRLQITPFGKTFFERMLRMFAGVGG